MSSKRVVIVGAGPGGLATAMLLGKQGVSVDVYEKLPRVGGRTTTWSGGDYRFDLGPTFFLYPRVLEEIFRLAGTDLHAHVQMKKLDPQYRIQFGDGNRIDANADPAWMKEQIDAIQPGDGDGFVRFMAENRKKLQGFRPVLEMPFGSLFALLSPDVLKLLPMIRPQNSLDTELKRYFSDPRVRLAFSFQSKYLGMSPFRCPSIFSILSHLEYEFGVFHPIGGHGAVVEAMREVAEGHGVRFHLGEPVDEVLYEGKKAVGVRTRTGTHTADAVVVNADFAHAMKRIVPESKRKRWTNKKIDNSRYSCSTFMLYLGIEGEVDLPHHTIFVPETYERNLREIEKEHVLSADPSVYVQNACVTDPGLAPKGHSTLYVLVPVTHKTDNVDWTVEKDRFREVVLDQLGSKLGLTDLRERIRYERVVTPDDWEQKYAVHDGAVFNLAHDLRQMLHLRPHNRYEDSKNMYLVGGGTHPGSGLPVIFESARISSRLLCEDLGMNVDWTVPAPQPRVVPSLDEVA